MCVLTGRRLGTPVARASPASERLLASYGPRAGTRGGAARSGGATAPGLHLGRHTRAAAGGLLALDGSYLGYLWTPTFNMK